VHSPDKRPGPMNVFRSVLLLAALVLVVGCSSMPRSDAPDRAARAEPAGRNAAQASEPASGATTRRRRRDYPEFETDETGFTITEQVRISGDVRADYQSALRLLQQERYEQGIPLLLEVTVKAPEITAPHIDLGIAYGRSGDFELAEAALQQASLLSPDHPIVHNELGILYRKTGRFSAARASYEEALAIYPGFHLARRNLAVLCDLYLADLNCALEHYEAYMQSVVDDNQVAIWIADIRNRLGR